VFGSNVAVLDEQSQLMSGRTASQYGFQTDTLVTGNAFGENIFSENISFADNSLLAAANTTLLVIGQHPMGLMPSNYAGFSRVSVQPPRATTYSLLAARPGGYATPYWPGVPSVNPVWNGDPLYGPYPPPHRPTWPMAPAMYQGPVASVAQSVAAPQAVDLGQSTATQTTTTTTSSVSVIDVSTPQTQTDVTATTRVVGAMSGPAGMAVSPGFQPTAAAAPDAGRSTTVAMDPTTTTTTTDLPPSTRPSMTSTSASSTQTADIRADVTSSTTTAAAAGHTPLSTNAGSATSSSMSGVAAPAGQPPLPSSLSTPVAVVVSTTAAATTSPAAPVVVVRQFQPVRPYNGSTSWKLFREHYRRVAKVNSWTSNEELLSHLTLALEGPAAEVLRDFDETAPTALTDLWARLEHRFGEVDGAREAMRRFEARKQSETESVVEFEQALRVLYREA